MSFLHFALWQSAEAHTSQHLGLFAQVPVDGNMGTALAHWELPELAHHRLTLQSHSLLAEAARVPPASHLLDIGRCTLLTGELPLHTEQERLCFRFEGRTLRGYFALLRLRAGSSRWLFGRLQYMPDEFRHSSQAAPLWPVTQTTSV